MTASPYLLSSYAYELDPNQIAQIPVFPPESARLLTLSQDATVGHGDFFQLPSALASESLVFLNDTKVLPARISTTFTIEYRGVRREKKGEILYLNLVEFANPTGSEAFEAMVYPGDSFPV